MEKNWIIKKIGVKKWNLGWLIIGMFAAIPLFQFGWNVLGSIALTILITGFIITVIIPEENQLYLPKTIGSPIPI